MTKVIIPMQTPGVFSYPRDQEDDCQDVPFDDQLLYSVNVICDK